MTFYPYIPGKPGSTDRTEFNNRSEIELIPRVISAIAKPGFHRLSLDMEIECPALIAEFDNGAHWEVLGLITPPVFQIGLPIFRFRAIAFAA